MIVLQLRSYNFRLRCNAIFYSAISSEVFSGLVYYPKIQKLLFGPQLFFHRNSFLSISNKSGYSLIISRTSLKRKSPDYEITRTSSLNLL